jgi:pimeloyl-ACP methyl ester carboxylesterase
VGVAAFVLFALVVLGLLYQTVGSRRNARQFPPPGQLVDVGHRRLHTVCLGSGSPAVLLESGIAASSLSWTLVQQRVAQFTRVCAYDRAGLAWSDAAPPPRTVDLIVGDLHKLLTTAKLAVPYILVGHSFGAFVCLAYAAEYPNETAGLVLVDPPTEWVELTRRQRRMLQGGIYLSRLGELLARLGFVRACLAMLTGGAPGIPRNFVKVFGPTTARTLERLVGEVQKLPPHIHPVVQALWCQPKCFRAMADHLGVLGAKAPTVTRAAIADLPLVVMSSADQPANVLAAHKVLAQMSTRGRHVVAANSGHWIQLDEPELVVDTIREVVEIARQRLTEPAETISTQRRSQRGDREDRGDL